MRRIVGLDVSPEAVRLVALESGFRGFRVLDAKSVAMGADALQGDNLKRALEELGLSPDDAVAIALPASHVASHQFTLPFTDPRRIEQVLPAEVEGAIPFEIEEVVWDHCVLSQENGKSQVLVAVVQKSVLKKALDDLHAVGVEPRTVTCAPMALAALEEKKLLALSAASSEAVASAPQGSVLLLEGGPERASVTLLYRGAIELARSLSAAPIALWNAAQSGDADAVERLLAPLARDLKLALRSRALTGPKAPARALLVGPLALLPGGVARLSELLPFPCEALSLDAAAQLPTDALPPPEIALALSLALRAQHPRGHINFRKGELAFTKDLSQQRGQLVRVAIAAGVVLALALGSTIARLSSLSHQASAYDEALCAATKKVLGNCLTDYRVAVSQMSGGSSKAAGVPRVSGSEVLAEVLAHFPEAAVPFIEDIEVTTTSVRLKGVAEGFAAVDQIVAGLKTDKCLGEIKQSRIEKQKDSQKIGFALDFAYTCSGETTGGA